LFNRLALGARRLVTPSVISLILAALFFGHGIAFKPTSHGHGKCHANGPWGLPARDIFV